MTLPVNVDTTYPDDAEDASRKLHQQHHDTVHAAVNRIPADGAAVVTETSGGAAYQGLQIFDVTSAAFGGVGDGVTNDATAILAARDAAYAAGGGVVQCPLNHAVGATIDLTSTPGVYLSGRGIGASTLRPTAGFGGKMVALGDANGISNIAVVLPTTMTDHGITVQTNPTASSVAPVKGVSVQNVYVTGGSGATYFAWNVSDTFSARFSHIVTKVSCNGWKITTTHGDYNYGNSIWEVCEVTLLAGSTTGWDLSGVTGGTKNFNLSQFNYISAVTGVGSCTGLKIRSCSFLGFHNADIEGCAVALDADKATVGAFAQGLVFTAPYFNAGDVNIGSGAPAMVFLGGRIYGTVTDLAVNSGKTTRWVGTTDGAGIHIQENAATSLFQASPRFASAGLTVALRNNQGATATRGTVVRASGSLDWAFKITDAATLPEWVGVVTADTANAVDAAVAVAGVVYVRCTNAATRGDYLVLDAAAAGQVKSNGTTAPATAGHFVGVAMETTGAAGVVACRLSGFNPT